MAKGFDETTTLAVRWRKAEKDRVITYPKISSGWLMHDFLCEPAFQALIKELAERGYDLSTLRFSVKLKEGEQ
ncbi:hypothetical protein JK635_08235 [Neobacillus sp. YIM B02564]|uniref:Uncharacterized protein n=1 Tax=Neobacillus paridis TaxID=2803862 RepID=A0ABS1TPN9_9BACI|nr:hypothetical protein [Neobacillus paridis]MBL4952196.1 hypothetical protein [Neobacillus paridis]